MKKIFSFLLIVSMLFLTVSCGQASSEGSFESPSGKSFGTSCNHTWKAATCDSPKTCSKCGTTSGSALGHTTTTGKCSRCDKNVSSWALGEFVDEFKKPTGQKYISTTIYNGTFSNSATTNSPLSACVQVTSETIAIILWEYGSQLVKGTFDTNEYEIIVLDQNNQKHYLSGIMYQGNMRVYVLNSDESELLTLLKKAGKLSFYLENSKYTTSTYLFTIDTTGFSGLYATLK